MKHEGSPSYSTIVQGGAHTLHRDFETRSPVDLRKVGAHVYAGHPSTQIICVAYAVDDGPVQLWRPGEPVPEECSRPRPIRAGPRARTTARSRAPSRNYILHPRHGFPLIPPERQRCTHGDEPGARTAGEAEQAGRRAGADHRKDSGRRTADAYDVEAAEAAQGRRS